MAEKKKFLLRIDNDVYTALEKWAADELRSINAQIEFLLAEVLKRKKRENVREDDSLRTGTSENLKD